MNKYFIPENILNELPLRFRIVEKIELNETGRHLVGRFVKNNFYNSSGFICVKNYRKTSKLIQFK